MFVNKGAVKLSFLNQDDHKHINAIGKALSHPIRTKFLTLLHNHPCTIGELAKNTNIDIKTALFHIDVLVKSGIVKVNRLPNKKEGINIYKIDFFNIDLDYPDESGTNFDIQTYQEEMPVGLYIDIKTDQFFRFATQEKIHYPNQDELFTKDRIHAGLLWTKGGMVKYAFSTAFMNKGKINDINFSFEICSETFGFRNDYKSDIYISVNNIPLGIHTCKGDYGDIVGKYNPPYWDRNHTQYGDLLVVTINNDGTYINHKKVSDVTLNDLKINENNNLTLTIENKLNSTHYGGFNLFGKGFGNYDQDILLTVNYIE